MHFANISTYAKPVKDEWAAAVAEYLEKVGATDLDDPNAPKRKTPRTDAQLRELEGIERKKAEERAQAEYKAATERLKNGTAVLRQPKERTLVPIVVTKPKAKKIAKKPTKPRKARAKKPAKVVLTKNYRQLREAALNNRIKSMLKMLNAGGKIEMLVSTDRKNHALYCLQRKDIVRLRERASEDIIRVKNISSGKSHFMLDRYPRYSTDTPINILEPKALLRALTSGKLVHVDSIKQNLSHVYKHITELVKSHGFNICSIHADNKQVIGWILLEDESKEAAYKEFEVIAAGIGATVKQVVAVGNGQ